MVNVLCWCSTLSTPDDSKAFLQIKPLMVVDGSYSCPQVVYQRPGCHNYILLHAENVRSGWSENWTSLNRQCELKSEEQEKIWEVCLMWLNVFSVCSLCSCLSAKATQTAITKLHSPNQTLWFKQRNQLELLMLSCWDSSDNLTGNTGNLWVRPVC